MATAACRGAWACTDRLLRVHKTEPTKDEGAGRGANPVSSAGARLGGKMLPKGVIKRNLAALPLEMNFHSPFGNVVEKETSHNSSFGNVV